MTGQPAAAQPAAAQRARGAARVSFVRRSVNGAIETRLDELFQDGCAKVRLPHTYGGAAPVAVLLNTAGGITGGDRIAYAAEWGEGTRASVTTQAAERIYRRSDGVGRIDNDVVVGAGAEAHWLPQETIVFDRSGLDRRLTIALAPGARLIACESVVLGRTAMGEDVREVTLNDQWRVRRGGRLVYADGLRLEGDTREVLGGGATGGGARAFATVLVAEAGAAERLDAVRGLLSARCAAVAGIEAGASAFDDLLSIRLLAQDGRRLRAILEPVIETLTGAPLPRAWSV